MYRPLKKKNVVFIWVSLYLWFGKLANLIYGNIEYFTVEVKSTYYSIYKKSETAQTTFAIFSIDIFTLWSGGADLAGMIVFYERPAVSSPQEKIITGQLKF